MAANDTRTEIDNLFADLARRGLGARRIANPEAAEMVAWWHYRQLADGQDVSDVALDYAEARARDVIADRRFAAELAAADAAGELVRHEPGDGSACTLGYWHTGDCD